VLVTSIHKFTPALHVCISLQTFIINSYYSNLPLRNFYRGLFYLPTPLSPTRGAKTKCLQIFGWKQMEQFKQTEAGDLKSSKLDVMITLP
jgi:hypothetical protein